MTHEQRISEMERRIDNVTRLLDTVVYTVGEIILQLKDAPTEWDDWKRDFVHEHTLLLSERAGLVENFRTNFGSVEDRLQEVKEVAEAGHMARLAEVAKAHRAELARNRREKARAKTLREKYQEQAGKPVDVDVNAKQEKKRNAKNRKS